MYLSRCSCSKFLIHLSYKRMAVTILNNMYNWHMTEKKLTIECQFNLVPSLSFQWRPGFQELPSLVFLLIHWYPILLLSCHQGKIAFSSTPVWILLKDAIFLFGFCDFHRVSVFGCHLLIWWKLFVLLKSFLCFCLCT